jgi:hypothetical protein
MAPPGYICWFEYNRPTGISTTRKDFQEIFRRESIPRKTGVLVVAVDPRDPELRPYFDKVNDDMIKDALHSIWQKQERPLRDIRAARMLLRCEVFVQHEFDEHLMFGPMTDFYLWLDENFDCFEYIMMMPVADGAESPIKEGEGTGMDNMIYPAMLTMTMMNLKNVKAETVDPAQQFKKRNTEEYRAKHGTDRLSYRTLEITPVASLTKMAMTADPQKGVERKVRSHVYRGYVLRSGVDGRGHLFGNKKIVGRYWVAPGRRGSAEAGEVVKDYKIGKVKDAE